MRVLSVASEAVPLAKTGGLADVVGALPGALRPLGVDMRVMLPGYPAVLAKARKPKPLHRYDDLFGGAATIVAFDADGLNLFVLDAPHLYDRPGGPYGPSGGGDWPDNWRRYAALGRAAADVSSGLLERWRPDLVHAHDWQAAMVPAYLRYGPPEVSVPSVMTVHNLAFQGQFAASIFSELGLPPEAMALDGVEYYGGVGFLKAGLQSANAITTVSPTYAQEIRTPAFGMGLDGLLNLRAVDLLGVTNGIDVQAWNPSSDPALAATYTASTLRKREVNRCAVERRFGITEHDGPLVCIISRLTWQKGMDLLVSEFDRLIGAGLRIAVLGSGDAALQGALIAATARHRGRAGAVIGYDEELSHLMQGGCDAILIPSRFEPCGLTQLYGLRYGCVPIVSRTGGLADTVVDANEAALGLGVATGIVFAPDSGDALIDAATRVVALFRDRSAWTAMQKLGMRCDVSWERSAQKYASLYATLLKNGS